MTNSNLVAKQDDGSILAKTPEGQVVRFMPVGHNNVPLKGKRTRKQSIKSIKASNLPSAYTLPEFSLLEAKNQGQWGSCTAHAASYMLEIAFARYFGYYQKFSTDFLYGNRKIYDVVSLQTTESGMNDEEFLSRLFSYGSLPWDMMPGSHDVPTAHDLITVNSESYRDTAAGYRMFKCATGLTNTDAIKQALYDGKVCCISIEAYGYSDDYNNHKFTAAGTHLGEHELCLIGWNEEGLLVINSWTENKDDCVWTLPYSSLAEIFDTAMALEIDRPKEYYKKLVTSHCFCSSSFYLAASDELISYVAIYGRTRDDLLTAVKNCTGSFDTTYKNSYKCPMNETSSQDSNFMFPGNVQTVDKLNTINDTDIVYNDTIAGELSNSSDSPLLVINKDDDAVDGIPGSMLCAPGIQGLMPSPLFKTDGTVNWSTVAKYYGNPYTATVSQVMEILGSTALISDSVISALSNKEGYAQERLYGINRYDSAAKIATRIRRSSVSKVFVVNQADFPDAICAAALGGKKYIPLLYVDGSATLNAETKNFISTWGIQEVDILGGPALVPDSVMTQISAISTVQTVNRVYDANRYSSSAAIARNFLLDGEEQNIVLAVGTDYSKCGSAAMIANIMGGPVLFCDGTSLDPAVASLINEYKYRYTSPIILGSPAKYFSTTLLNSLNS